MSIGANDQTMGFIRSYCFVLSIHLCHDSVCSQSTLSQYRCINRRRIKRGGGPVRYTGWTVPTYNQSQQQYGYATDNHNMNNYSQQPQAPYSSGNQAYQGQPGYTAGQDYGNNAAQSGPAYYDATQTQEQGI